MAEFSALLDGSDVDVFDFLRPQETWQGEQKEQKSSSKRHDQLPPFPFPSGSLSE
jgi:hypothetical protein